MALSLAAVRSSLSENTPRTHSHKRLQHLIAASLGVGFGIIEAGETVPLVGFRTCQATGASITPISTMISACLAFMPPKNSPMIAIGR